MYKEFLEPQTDFNLPNTFWNTCVRNNHSQRESVLETTVSKPQTIPPVLRPISTRHTTPLPLKPPGHTYVLTVTMCVTNVYVDRYPDGKESEFRQTSFCQYGQPGRPCQKLSTLENPVRKIQFGEPTTEYMMTAHQRTFPQTPPRSSGGSHHRHSSDYSSEDGRPQRRKSTKRRSDIPALRPTRTHRKERIVIVDSPPTPRTPPQTFRTFTAPSSPASTPFVVDGALPLPRERGRPVIVDERPLLRHPRVPSIGAVVGERSIPRRARSQSDRKSVV